MRRVADVLDCWFESGAMPFAARHAPFAAPADGGPGDFVAEYVAQTRGWFYTMTVLSTALFAAPPFTRALCHGVLLGEDGRKMSKRLRNYTDPMALVAAHGADALRVALLTSGVVDGADARFAAAAVRDVVRRLHLPWWNALHLVTAYAVGDGWAPDPTAATAMLHTLKPVTPCDPKVVKSCPPMTAPTMPTTMLVSTPAPWLLTIRLPMKPLMRPSRSHARMDIDVSLWQRGCRGIRLAVARRAPLLRPARCGRGEFDLDAPIRALKGELSKTLKKSGMNPDTIVKLVDQQVMASMGNLDLDKTIQTLGKLPVAARHRTQWRGELQACAAHGHPRCGGAPAAVDQPGQCLLELRAQARRVAQRV